MKQHDILIGMLIEETETFSYKEVCTKYNITTDLLEEMVEHGLFSNKSTDLKQLQFNPKELQRIESAFRLHQDLGVNLPGVVLAIELLEKIQHMDEELVILRKQIREL